MMQHRETISHQTRYHSGDLVVSEGYGSLKPVSPSISMALTYRPQQSGPVMSAAPIAGHRTGHVFPHQRAPSILFRLRRFILWGQETGSSRFRRPSDWLRVVALGVILLDFALLSLGNRFLERHFEGYLPGLGPMLGGLLFAIIMMRLERPASYPDWIAIGAFQAAMGCVICVDKGLQSFAVLLLFFCLFLGLALLRLWVGETLRPRRGAISLLAGGWTTVFLIMWLIADRCLGFGIGPDIVLAADLLVGGFTMISFGLSLRPGKNCEGPIS